MRLFLFDDGVADGWHPFSLSRPCGELLFGSLLLRERLERLAGLQAAATLSRPWLTGFREDGAPPVLTRDSALPDVGRLLLCTRAVPSDGITLEDALDRPTLIRVGGAVAGCYLPAGSPDPGAGWLLEPAKLPGVAAEVDLAGGLLPAAWSLVEEIAERLARDLAATSETERAALPKGVHRVGSGPVSLGDGILLEPGVLLDTTQGGIHLEDGVEVRAGARLAGPLHAGAGTRLLGGSFASLSAGPRCNLRGEIEHTVVLGYSNKAHDGFLGHAYLGRWVNLGALTTNSDLKNNYGPVRVGTPDGDVDTGLLKLGCLVGDHVKTAIGTLLNTGTAIGAGANLFGVGPPPRWVEPFSWGFGRSAAVYDRERFLDAAARVMERRDVAFDLGVRKWLAAVWEAGVERVDGR